MTIEEIKSEIVRAIESKEVTARGIDKKGKGTNITHIREGMAVREKTIQELYTQLLAIRGNLPIRSQEPAKATKKQAKGNLAQALAEIARMKEQQIEYERTIADLREKQQQPEQKQIQESKGKEKILCFSLMQKLDHGKLYWYACKKNKGKLSWVYIGKEKNKAEEKIKIWLNNIGIKA